MRNIYQKIKITCICLLAMLIIFLFNQNIAYAHSPHDDIYDIELSPTYTQDKTLFTIVRGNLIKSKDEGANWQRLVQGLDNKFRLSSLAISSQSKKILYVSSLGDGIYKSIDEGNSWQKVNQGLTSLNINLVSVSLNSDKTLLATSAEKGLFYSANGGKSWSQALISDNLFTTVTFVPKYPEKMFVGDQQGNLYSSIDGGYQWEKLYTFKNSGAIQTILLSSNYPMNKTILVGTEKAGVFKTINEGKTFSEINKGITDKSIVSLALSSNNLSTKIYASTWNKGVFLSTNEGASWQYSSRGLTKSSQADQTDFKRPNFGVLQVSNVINSNQKIYLGSFDGLFQSVNDGQNWSEIQTLPAEILTSVAISPNYENDQTLAISTYLGGAYLSKDSGLTWKSINKGIEEYLSRYHITRLFEVVFSPNYSKDNTIFASSWTHFLRSNDSGEHWQKIEFPKQFWWLRLMQTSWWFNQIGSQKPTIAISPDFTVDHTIYLANWRGKIFQSTNEGMSFSSLANLTVSISNLKFSPDFANDKTIFAVSSNGVYKTENTGKQWQLIWQPKGDEKHTLLKDLKLEISPNYKADKTAIMGTIKGMFITNNGGGNWQRISTFAELENAYIEAISFSPNYQKDRTFLVSAKGIGLFKTEDSGNSFTQTGTDLLNRNYLFAHMNHFPSTTNPIQFSPSYERDSTLYGFSDTQLLKSSNLGNSWELLNIPDSPIISGITYYYYRLTVSPIRRFLLAAIAAFLSYLILGRLHLEKMFSIKPIVVKVMGCFTVFIGLFGLISA